jgi:plastocyanin
MKTRRTRAFALVAVLTVLLAGCSGEEQVGSDELLDFEEQSEGARLGERKVASEKAPAGTAKPARKRKHAAPAPSPKPARAVQPSPEEKKDTGPDIALEIKITGDQSGTSQFDPSAARIFDGTCARWKNTDSAARSVEADDDSFRSGMIKPGKTWTWCPKSTGTFNYHDGTRPYAVAYIEVVKR